MGDNPFKIQERTREQHLKERATPAAQETAAASSRPVVLELESRKRRKQTYTVYLDKNLMERVKSLAKRKDVSSSTVIEACIKISLEQLEG